MQGYSTHKVFTGGNLIWEISLSLWLPQWALFPLFYTGDSRVSWVWLYVIFKDDFDWDFCLTLWNYPYTFPKVWSTNMPSLWNCDQSPSLVVKGEREKVDNIHERDSKWINSPFYSSISQTGISLFVCLRKQRPVLRVEVQDTVPKDLTPTSVTYKV